MKIRVQMIVELDNGVGEVVQDIARLERGQLRPEQLGLTLTEAKGPLKGIQRTVVEQRDWEELPRPDMPLTVGIDGGYVDSCERKGKKDGALR
jgi:hypothetical protein